MKQEFKKQLDETELNKLFETMNSSDDKELKKEIRNTIIEHNLTLVNNTASKYLNNKYNLTLDELCSEGTLGLIEAVEKFDNSKKFKFSQFAFLYINSRILDCFKRGTHMKYYRFNQLSMEQDTDEIEELYYDYNLEDLTESKMFVEEILKDKKIKPKDLQVISLLIGLENDNVYKIKDVSEMLNISESRISQIKIKTSERLRGLIENEHICIR